MHLPLLCYVHRHSTVPVDSPEAQKKLLEAEGHRVIKKGKSYVVDGFESRIAKINVSRI